MTTDLTGKKTAVNSTELQKGTPRAEGDAVETGQRRAADERAGTFPGCQYIYWTAVVLNHSHDVCIKTKECDGLSTKNSPGFAIMPVKINIGLCSMNAFGLQHSQFLLTNRRVTLLWWLPITLKKSRCGPATKTTLSAVFRTGRCHKWGYREPPNVFIASRAKFC